MFFLGGDAHFVISIAKYVEKQEFSYSKNQKVSKKSNLEGNSKNSRKNTKLKEKTQTLAGFRPA